jgi:hypothetical protein
MACDFETLLQPNLGHWVKLQSITWFFHFLFGTYVNERWIPYCRMTKHTLFGIAHQVKPLIGKQNTKY